MDWLHKTTIATALAASLVATGAARAQTRPSVLATGVGSAVAQPTNSSAPDVIFVSPQVGVAEAAQPVDAYDEDRAPTPSKGATTPAYADALAVEDATSEPASVDSELEREKLHAAEIFAKTQERAAMRRQHKTRAINAPMTLGALKSKPSARPASQSPRVATNPQFQQYSPSRQAPPTAFQISPGPTVLSTENHASTGAAPNLNWDGSSRREGMQFGRTQAPSLQQPEVYGLMPEHFANSDEKDEASADAETQQAQQASTNAQQPNRADVSDAVAQEAETNANALEAGLESPFDDPPSDALTTIEALSPVTPLETGEEESEETPSINSLPPFEEPDPNAGIILDAPEEEPTLDALEALDPRSEPQTPQPVFQEPTLENTTPTPAPPATPNAPESPTVIENVPVPPIKVEPAKPQPQPAPVAQKPQPQPAPTAQKTQPQPAPTAQELQPQPAPNAAQPLPPTPTTDANANEAPAQVEKVEPEESKEPEAPSPQPQENKGQDEPLTLDLPYCSPYGYERVDVPTPTVTSVPTDNPAVRQLIAQPNCQPNFAPTAPQWTPQAFAQPQYASYAPCAAPTFDYAAPSCQPRSIPRTFGVPQPPRGTFGLQPLQGSYVEQDFYSAAPLDGEYYDDCVARPYGLIGGAEWLAWRTDSDKPYARVMSASGVTLDERDLQTSGSGLRGRVGFRALSGWEIVGSYTWYDADESESLAANGARLVSPQRALVGVYDAYDAIGATLKTELQNVDLEIGKWNDSGAFSFRPFAGFRWTQFNEEFSNTFTTNATGTSSGIMATTSMLDGADDVETVFSHAVTDAAGVTQESVFARSRLNAYGLRVGADVNLALTQGLSVYGKGAGAIAVGDVKSLSYVGDAANSRTIKKTYATPSLEGGVGLSWKRNGLEVRGGYEFNAWYNASYLNGRKSDFLAHGYVAGLGWNY